MESLHDLLNDILAGSPSPGTLFIVLSKMKEDGRLKEVIQECNKALNIYADDIRIRQLLVESYLDSGQMSLAETESEKALEQILALISIYKTQADIFRRQGRKAEALKALKIYLAHRPDDKEALELLAELEPEKEDIEEMIMPEYQETLTEIATPTLAEIYLEQGQLMEAINTYKKILERNPDDRRSALRLEELRTQTQKLGPSGDNPQDRVRNSKKKMITTLENWLMNIRRQTELIA
jgi:tetratricopeptide (TPR) repeat protein